MPVPISVSDWTISSLYRAADIFVLPTFIDPIFVYLEAMAHGLPVVTTDVAHGPQLVEDGITGFVIESPLNWMDWTTESEWQDSRGFEQLVRTSSFPSVVSNLVDRLGTLIEDRKLRLRMGEAARQRVEIGPLSVKVRNENLRRIYAEALGKKSRNVVCT